MTAPMNTQIDVSVLKNQMGIEVIDDGNGYLSEGDLLISRSESAVNRHTLTASNFSTATELAALLNLYTGNRTSVSVVFDSQRAKSFIASVSEDTSYMRLFEVTPSQDTAIISDGTAVPAPNAQPRVNIGGLLGAMGTPALGYVPLIPTRSPDSFDNLQGSRWVSMDLATTECDFRETDPEKLACYQNLDEARVREENRIYWEARAQTAKDKIRTAVLSGTLTPEIIAEFTQIQEQIDAL